jgi:branched-chain amino acid aminotransferase
VGRSELDTCDELFFTGTAVEIAPVVKVDHRAVGTGAIGRITAALRGLYINATRGRMAAYRDWVAPVYRPAGIKAA